MGAASLRARPTPHWAQPAQRRIRKGRPPLVKICCIASVAEALMAQQAGAAALGLVSARPSGPGVVSDAVVAAVVAAVRGQKLRTFLLTARTRAESIAAQHKDAGTTTLQRVDHVPHADLRRLRLLCIGVERVQVIHVTRSEGRLDAVKLGAFMAAMAAQLNCMSESGATGECDRRRVTPL